MRLGSAILIGFFLFANVTSLPFSTSYIKIDKSENRLVYYSYHVPIRSFAVATGREHDDTPTGTYTVVMLVKKPWYLKKNIPGGDPNNPLGERWIGLDVPGTDGSKYGIHGTNQPELIGQHVSAGCVRMKNEEITWLYDHVQVGTMVEIVE
ncbi:L,D-transpeptidase [Tumebacillus lipolyticus]|uniref:L,D-transpeptidase n=1 Tax=Tumebacillus lipolyticus TaxID=1280370 RepID=A0ABW4ZZZ5_9BACL